VNYLVQTWTENASFVRNLTSWSVPFWLVLLTEHKVLYRSAPNAVCCCRVEGHYCTRHADSFQQTTDASKSFQKGTTPLTDKRFFLIRIASSCEICVILFNFTDNYVPTDSQGKVAALNRLGGKMKTFCRWPVVSVISVPQIFVNGQF